MALSRFLICPCVVASMLGTSAMAQFTKPGPEHKILAADEGTWDATVKSFAAGPDAEPTVSKGTEVNTVLPGGLWVLSKFEGDFDGLKFEGRGQFGYDPLKKKYIGTWIDSLMPNLMVLEGSYDAKSRTMTFVGESIEPNSKTPYTQKMVTTLKDDGTRLFTLYMKHDKDEVKFMEIEYKKRK